MANQAFLKKDFPLIGSTALSAINVDVVSVSEKRYEAVKLALQEAYDADSGSRAYPKSLYIRGGNLYNKDLSLNRITESKLSSYLKRADYAEFYEGRESMLQAAVENQDDCTGADCSGGVVGIWRKTGLSSSGMDATADSLCGNSYSSAISKDELLPGDYVGRSGHIGLYVGGGYVVEWVGGSYGCQLTKLSGRVAYDFVQKKDRKMGAWTKYRRPKAFASEPVKSTASASAPVKTGSTSTPKGNISGNYVEVMADSVNIRDKGNTSGTILGVAKKGDQFEHQGRASSGWFKISFNGKEGYISDETDLTHYVFRANLKYGSKGEAVKELKRLLNANGGKLSINNGNYLGSTRATVKRFQKAKGLAVDGIAGPLTIRALGGTYA